MLKGEVSYLVEDFFNAIFHRVIIIAIFISFFIFLYSIFLFYRSTDLKTKIKSWFNNNLGFLFNNDAEIDNFNDIDGHASLIEACDILVMSSNSSAHIAGALGKKIHLLVPSSRDVLWYWCNNNNSKNLWYPSINIYQQTIPDNWKDEILIINSEIQLNY